AAVAAAAAAVGSRLVPGFAAAVLGAERRPDGVRIVRGWATVATAVAGVVTVAAVTAASAERWCLAVALTAGVAVVLQHRPASPRPTVAVGAEWLECLALMGLPPLLAVATRAWWQ
ncbi:MAG: hypothetical protein QM572_05965, partial [Nocardioides sp.]|uniref:hypothetical protein n=1 Tax=Nocardioides sp. TaxID=35761 RepID=UPI0039E39132